MSEAEVRTPGEAAPGETLRLLLRGALGLLLLLGSVWALGALFDQELQWIGQTFVKRFGLWGMALGTWLADGFNFPVPPQFYMLMAITSGTSQVKAFVAIAVGSVFGGVSAYCLAPQLSRWARIERAVRRSRPTLHRFSGEGWVRGVVVLSATPFAFSWLCYAAGLYHLPKRAFVLICLLRLPKLLLYQWLVNLGWHGLGS